MSKLSKKQPNILFLFTDQHRADAMSCAGHPVVNTPNLDRLAASGTRFTQAYCSNPLCGPSRTSVMTGQYSRNTGIYTNTDMLEPNSDTVARSLSRAGYRTCLIGKMHFNGEQYHGFQERPYGDLYGQAHQPDPRRTPTNGAAGLGELVENAGPTEIPLPMTQTEVCVSEASKWIQTHVDLHPQQPFFLSVNFDKPHFPVRCPQQFYDNYKGRSRVPAVPDDYYERAVPFVKKAMDKFGFAGQDGNQYLDAYYGCIEWVDDAIGRILDVMDYLDLTKDTLIIYSSDHGDLCGEKGAWNKTLFFDSATKVPLIMSYPSVIGANQTSDELLSLVDLFPTFCDVASVERPESCDGQSFLSLLSGGTLDLDHIYCESAFLGDPEHSGCMLRQGEWKFIYYLDGECELYNLKSDPDEWLNLANDESHQALVSDYTRQVTQWWNPDGQVSRIHSAPKSSREKHFYEFSNQFVLGNGAIANARP